MSTATRPSTPPAVPDFTTFLVAWALQGPLRGVAAARDRDPARCALVVIWWGIAPTPPVATGRLDLPDLGLVTLLIGLVTAGLVLVRVVGPGSALPWLALLSARRWCGRSPGSS